MATQPRAVALIDGANLYSTGKALELEIDFKRLLKLLKSNRYLLRAYYVTAIREDGEYTSIRPLLDWLDYNGYDLVTKSAREFRQSDGSTKVKASMGIEIAVLAAQIAPSVDEVYLFTGDGDFVPLVEYLKELGKRVIVVSTIETQPMMAADELRRVADEFWDLDSMRESIVKESRKA